MNGPDTTGPKSLTVEGLSTMLVNLRRDRRIILCPAHLERRITDLVESLGLTGVFDVTTSNTIPPPGRVLVFGVPVPLAGTVSPPTGP